MINHRVSQLVALLLIASALGLCAPDRASAEPLALPSIVTDGAHITPACDIATDDDLGLPSSKTGLLAVNAGAATVALVDAPPAAAEPPLPLVVARRLGLEVLASRAPPLV